MTDLRKGTALEILEEFRLAALPPLVDLRFLAHQWGVNSIEEQEIDSEAMLLPTRDGHRIVLRKVDRSSLLTRQRFSFAHELGHLLLQKSARTSTALKYRGHGYSDEEERLCDQIAAEILMPRLAFCEDGWMEGWSLKSLTTLAAKYHTSLTATARRMVDLMPEEALMGVWKVSPESNTALQWPHVGNTEYAIPSSKIFATERMELVHLAWNSTTIEEGVAPVRLGRRNPVDVPAEAMAWGRGEFKQVMVFYYPTRQPTSSPV